MHSDVSTMHKPSASESGQTTREFGQSKKESGKL